MLCMGKYNSSGVHYKGDHYNHSVCPCGVNYYCYHDRSEHYSYGKYSTHGKYYNHSDVSEKCTWGEKYNRSEYYNQTIAVNMTTPVLNTTAVMIRHMVSITHWMLSFQAFDTTRQPNVITTLMGLNLPNDPWHSVCPPSHPYPCAPTYLSCQHNVPTRPSAFSTP